MDAEAKLKERTATVELMQVIADSGFIDTSTFTASIETASAMALPISTVKTLHKRFVAMPIYKIASQIPVSSIATDGLDIMLANICNSTEPALFSSIEELLRMREPQTIQEASAEIYAAREYLSDFGQVKADNPSQALLLEVNGKGMQADIAKVRQLKARCDAVLSDKTLTENILSNAGQAENGHLSRLEKMASRLEHTAIYRFQKEEEEKRKAQEDATRMKLAVEKALQKRKEDEQKALREKNAANKRKNIELEAEKEARRKAAKLRTKKLRIKILSIAVTLIFAALATVLQLRKGSVPVKERSEMAEAASNKNGAN